MKLNELIRKKPDGEKGNTPKEPLTEAQRQKRKKMLVYPLMGLMFLGSLWLIFAPSAEEKAEEQAGTSFNTDMPLPTDAAIIGDKEKAYEQAKLEEQRRERNRAVQDLASLFESEEGQENKDSEEDYDLLNPGGSSSGYTGGGNRTPTAIHSSANAYQDINATLGNFYDSPEEDPEKEELQKRVEELEAMMEQQQEQPSSMDEQIALLEKSYELAAKYTGKNGQQENTVTEENE